MSVSTRVSTAAALIAMLISTSHAAESTAMRAGAARLDITPDEKALPKGYEGINDHIFVRAIVVDDGRTRAGLVTVDAGAVPTQIWSQVTQRAEKELHIPASQLLLTATHTHSVPF
jgi:hypothetical protein